MLLEHMDTLLKAGRPPGPFVPVAIPGITAKIQGGTMSDPADTLIGLYGTTGFEPENAMGRLVMEVHNLQTLVRAPKSVNAEALAFQAFEILHGYVGTISGVQYFGIMGRSVPFEIGQDENKRYQFSCNFIVRKAKG
jgi:hypothetical protein